VGECFAVRCVSFSETGFVVAFFGRHFRTDLRQVPDHIWLCNVIIVNDAQFQKGRETASQHQSQPSTRATTRRMESIG
jgi:hypothetical protein